MKKQSIGVAGALLCLMVFATSVLADNTIQLWVNHSQVKSDVEPQIVDGRVMVPLRAVAEALGAKVEWDEKNRSISIQTQQQATTEQQIALLEQAVAAKTPKEAAETWVKGVQTRNGALQYAVLSPEQKKASRSSFEAIHWVTGTSSPWVERYKLDEGKKNPDGTYNFAIWLDYRSSTDVSLPVDWSKIEPFSITVKEQDEKWVVSELPFD